MEKLNSRDLFKYNLIILIIYRKLLFNNKFFLKSKQFFGIDEFFISHGKRDYIVKSNLATHIVYLSKEDFVSTIKGFTKDHVYY